MRIPNRLLLLCLALWVTRIRAQDSGDDPKGGTLVDDGTGKVAIFAHTESPDGQYALGWTIRPDHNKTPVDWSTYDAKNPFDWIQKYPMNEDNMASGEYALLNGVVDLHAGKFTPFETGLPYWPHKNHANLGVAWSGDLHGTRYGIVNNDARWSTTNLWLVAITPGGVHVSDLATAAGKAVDGFVRKHSRQSARYEATFGATQDSGEGKPRNDPFKGKTLKVRFDAEIPKASGDAGYEGEITVVLPKGTVAGVTGKVSN